MRIKGQEDPSRVLRIVSRLVPVCKPVNHNNLAFATDNLFGNKLSQLSLDSCKSDLAHADYTQRQYSDLFDCAPIGYLMVDQFFRIVKINRTAAELLEINQHADITELFPLCTSAEDNDALKNIIKTVAAGAHAELSLHTTLDRATRTPVKLFFQRASADDSNQYYCQITIVDINGRTVTENKLTESRDYLQHLATHDELTQLPNRRLFNQSLSRFMIDANRDGHRLGIGLLDLDQFKVINDTLGHDVGDELLVKTAQRLQETVGSDNFVARLAGDEFMLVIRNIHQHSELAAILESVRLNLLQPYELSAATEIKVSASIGVSVFPTDASTVEELVSYADTAMYQAKSSGRSCVHFFTQDMGRALKRKNRLQKEIRIGIDQNDFETWYQPIYDCSTDTFASVEVLARWRHPERGLLPPREFIDLAEECGAIESLGYQILEKAFHQQHQLKQAGFGHIVVSVNISPRQIVALGFVKTVKELLRKQNADARKVEFELTENALLNAHLNADSEITKVISKLHTLGIRFTIDDFGTGYSSFSHLAKLPIGKIKVDQSITNSIPHDEDSVVMFNALTSLGKNLQFSVVSEGVETLEQYNFLRSAGCDEIQGFLMTEPMPDSELLSFLQTDSKKIRLLKEQPAKRQMHLCHALPV